MSPANTTGTGAYTLYYGTLDSPHILQVFIEMRDPDCAKMADSILGTIREAADDGKIVAKFHFAANLDDEVGGGGSRCALSALGAASDVGQSQFINYLGALFASQPHQVTDDPFSDASFLLSRASQVDGLRSAEFDQKVSQNAYANWAADAVADFETFGVLGTPTMWLDGRVVLGMPVGSTVTPAEFLAEIQK
ncbi:DsbA family protein [Streptomyces bobili]|uniref:DsbA family protein n=1 Tax=Streptomyces bobili TaxID=67280 RepID=UPI003710094F